MTSMKDREEGFERKFAHDEELRFKAEARRNRLLGEWLSSLTGVDAERCIESLIAADFEEGGDMDVFRKLRSDLDSAGVEVSDEELRNKMNELMALALEEVRN